MEPRELTRLVKERALELGFSAVGVAPAHRIPPEHLSLWLEENHHGKMEYMRRNSEKRLDPTRVLENAQSIISVALNYYHPYQLPYADDRLAVISRYASGDDYHDVIQKRLRQLLETIQEAHPGTRGRYYVDTGPLMDKYWAAQSGLGWLGKHTNVLSRTGSWFFLGALLLDQEMIYDAPVADHCGSCTRCIEACPTGAIVEPYLLDSRLCISYLTIELKEDIPITLRPQMENLVFGCDICQDVCPWNQKTPHSEVEEFAPRPENRDPSLSELARLSPEQFSRRFRKSPIKRPKWRGMMRNIAIALGNSGREEMIPPLKDLLNTDDPMVRRHAAWALVEIGTERALGAVRKRLKIEGDEATRAELATLLNKTAASNPCSE